jgi:hypothetical protein
MASLFAHMVAEAVEQREASDALATTMLRFQTLYLFVRIFAQSPPACLRGAMIRRSRIGRSYARKDPPWSWLRGIPMQR